MSGSTRSPITRSPIPGPPPDEGREPKATLELPLGQVARYSGIVSWCVNSDRCRCPWPSAIPTRRERASRPIASSTRRSRGQPPHWRRQQRPDGHFRFDLEADAAIPAEYVLMKAHSRPARRRDRAADRPISAPGARRRMAAGRCWRAGASNLSASVKAYMALKAAGDPIDAPHMTRARHRDPRGRWRGQRQRLHTHPARLFRHRPVAGGPGDAGRDHAAAALVAVPPLQNLLLGAPPHWCRCSC